MGAKTKIDWADASWNPVTGCLHGCEYCYARRIARRYCSNEHGHEGVAAPCNGDCKFCSELDGIEFLNQKVRWNHSPSAVYPFGFWPTFHPHRLDVPSRWKRPRTIFVCSMADLFGEWVPDEWIKEVFAACRRAKQHRYLFLTKNPDRYDELIDKGIITPEDTNFWLGSTCTVITRDGLHWNFKNHTFMSCEPIMAPWPQAGKTGSDPRKFPEWVILGAETGNRKDRVIPPKAWIDNAVAQCRNMGVPLFMKESLRQLMGADFVQEYPWEVKGDA